MVVIEFYSGKKARITLAANRRATVSKETIGFDVWMAAIFDLYQTTFQSKVFGNKLFNVVALFVVSKWPLRIEVAVIKLKWFNFFSKFCRLFRKDIDKSRLTEKSRLTLLESPILGLAFPVFYDPSRVSRPAFQVFRGSH